MRNYYLVLQKMDDGCFIVAYGDYDKQKCLDYATEMIHEGEFSKGNWNMAVFEIDSDVIDQIKEEF